MASDDRAAENINWQLTTWEGARREQLRRWADLPLEQIVLALEEMQELGKQFGVSTEQPAKAQRSP